MVLAKMVLETRGGGINGSKAKSCEPNANLFKNNNEVSKQQDIFLGVGCQKDMFSLNLVPLASCK